MTSQTKTSYPAVLDRVYSTNYASVDRQLSFLGELYDLPHYNHSLTIKNRGFFDYTSTIQQFVVLVVYSSKRKVFLLPGTDGSKEQYYLPARRVLPGSFIESAVRELSEEIFPERSLAGFEPVAILTHSFKFQQLDQTETHSMNGVAYIARLLDTNKRSKRVRNGAFFPFSEARNFLSQGLVGEYSNAEVLTCALERISSFLQLRVRQPDEEIESNVAAMNRYRLHETVVKPALKILKRSHQFESSLLASIGKPERFLDASCGDSKVVISVAQNGASLVTGNDISWSQITLLLEKIPRSLHHTTIFTNHNIVQLPFREDFFDVALCKNTLHHLNSPAEFQLVMLNLTRIARKVVIVEVEDPNLRLVPRLINRYYQRFLGDAGKNFFSEEEFKSALDGTFNGRSDLTICFSKFASLHANYLFAEIDRVEEPRSPGEESLQ